MNDATKLYNHLAKGLPAEFELLFPNPTSRRGKNGPLHRISFEAEKAVIDAFMDLPNNIRLKVMAYIVNDDESVGEETAEERPELNPDDFETAPAPRPKRQSGPYGQFWRELCHPDSVLNAPVFRAWLDEQRTVPGSSDADVITATFLTKSRAEISPDALITRLEDDLPIGQGKTSLLTALQRLALKHQRSNDGELSDGQTQD